MNIYSNIPSPEFKPTWLYIKQHNTTGLKYFGKTTKDPEGPRPQDGRIAPVATGSRG